MGYLPNAAFRRPRGWVMAMTWEDLLFAHWRVPVETLRALIPKGLELDLFGGEAWLSVVPFRMSRVHGRYLPSLPGLSAFPETNVRTYVTRKGAMPGVYFFSLDAADFVAVRAARKFFHLPYFDAEMSVRREGDGFRYSTRRTHAGAPAGELSISYAPIGPVYRTAQGTLEDWLGFPLRSEPALVQFAEKTAVAAWMPQRLV